MGFFDNLFGNKDKKNTEINNSNKKQIISILTQTQMTCKNADAMGLIRGIMTQLQGQCESADEELVPIDSAIITFVSEANKYILKQQYPTAIAKLVDALDKVIDRNEYCLMGGQMTKEDMKRAKEAKKIRDKILAAPKSREEQLQAQLDEKNAELDKLRSKFETLRELAKANPGNQSIQAMGVSVKSKMDVATSIINTLLVEIRNATLVDGMTTIANTNEQIAAGRVDEAVIENTVANVKVQQDEIARVNEINNAMANVMSTTVAAGNVFANASNATSYDVFADSTGAASSDVFANSTGANATAGKQTQYGGFNASEVGSTTMANDIRRTTQAIKNSLETYDEKIQDANDELADLNAELRPLLQRRQTASPSDCLALDGQIDQLNSKRSSIIYKIKRFRQEQAQLNDKLALLDKLDAQQDLTATNQKIEQLTGGKFADFAGLAMFLNEAVKESNEQLEEIGTAVSVAESEEIMMNSASGISAVLSDAGTLGKDEHKYDALANEIGLTLQV